MILSSFHELWWLKDQFCHVGEELNGSTKGNLH